MMVGVGGVSAMKGVLQSITVEPVMLIDGACKEAMLLFIENVQMNRICSVKLGLPKEVRLSVLVKKTVVMINKVLWLKGYDDYFALICYPYLAVSLFC